MKIFENIINVNRPIDRAVYIMAMFVFLLLSCHEIVTDEFPDFKPVPSVNAFLVEGETLKVHVSMAEKLDTNQLGFVDNAKIDLFVDGVFTESLSYIKDGEYLSSSIVKSQKEYKCKINVPGYEIVECSEFIPEKPIIKNIEHINIAGKDVEGSSYPAIKVTFKNELNTQSFYELEARYVEKFKEGNEDRKVGFHTITDPLILNEGLPIALFSNEIISDTLYTINLNYSIGHYSRRNGGPYRMVLHPMVIELRQVTEDYYRFKKQLYLYEEGLLADGVFTSKTNANIHSNVSNGYGIFAGYAATVSDTITPNTDGYYE